MSAQLSFTLWNSDKGAYAKLSALSKKGRKDRLGLPSTLCSLQIRFIERMAVMARLVAISVHPAIGIARVGNSNEWFVGPEQPAANPVPADGYKDQFGKIKKQAARFGVFAKFDNDDVKEYQGPVRWKVELANKKAAVIGFNSTVLRNAYVPVNYRDKLEIKGRSEVNSVGQVESIVGDFQVVNASGLTIGSSLSVKLGEAWIELDGQLLVRGGSGDAFSVLEPDAPVTHTFNNDLWCDDISDGSVTAEITIDGISYASTAWLIVAPPKFAPQLTPVVSLWDRLLDAHAKPPTNAFPSYTQHIWPILDRARKTRWVNSGADNHMAYWDTDPIYDQTLPTGKLVRENIFNALKGSGSLYANMPIQDTGRWGPDGDPDGDRLTNTQLNWMRNWSEGTFSRDWTGIPIPDAVITPDDLDQAALEACIGAALWPGIEAGQYLLRKDIWKQFPRLDDTVVKPGDVTARMALPWHTDFLECGESWWPVARPHQVKPERRPGTYREWNHRISDNEQMVAEWDTLGFVIREGTQFLEVEAKDVPYVFIVSPELDFGAVTAGATKTRAVSLEAVTGTLAVTLRADPPTGPFSLVSPDEVILQPKTGPQNLKFLVQYDGGTTAEEGELRVHGPGSRNWTVRLRVSPRSYD